MIRPQKKTTEKRAAIRISCEAPLMFKICKPKTISKIMEGYTKNVSKDGLQCSINEQVPVGSTLWLKLDRDTLVLCEEIDKRAVILQQGILGQVIWIAPVREHQFDIGLQFLIREEKI